MSVEENARAALAKLEHNPKYTTVTKEADEQTRNGDMNNPKNHKKDGAQDARWHKDADGNYHHPDFE